MTINECAVTERREFRDNLQNVVDEQQDLGTIPLALAEAIRHSAVEPDRKRRAFQMIRDWANYARDNEVPEDPYAVRYHITQFAAQELGKTHTQETLYEVDVMGLTHGAASYIDILGNHIASEVFSDPDVAIVGGAARLALKIYAGVDIQPELPLSDVDVVMTSSTHDVASKAEAYGIDLAGTKIVDGDIRTALDSLVTNCDCTMNQVAVYDGKLIFSAKALEDIKEGNIRLIAKNDPLFGSEGVVLPDGNVYLNRVGFYRGLSFLLRGKGERLVVSQENIEREKDTIGRYWLIMLFVKILPMKDEKARYNAIGHWHELAKRMSATSSAHPEEFMNELMESYPTTNASKKREYNAKTQARWIVGRLVNQATAALYEQEAFEPPETYTEAGLSLADDFDNYDYTSFMDAVGKTGQY